MLAYYNTLNGIKAQLWVLSTLLFHLNLFLDSEMEQILRFDTVIDAKGFCKDKSVLFIVLPEEDLTKYFMMSLMIQQLYREIWGGAAKNGCKQAAFQILFRHTAQKDSKLPFRCLEIRGSKLFLPIEIKCSR